MCPCPTCSTDHIRARTDVLPLATGRYACAPALRRAAGSNQTYRSKALGLGLVGSMLTDTLGRALAAGLGGVLMVSALALSVPLGAQQQQQTTR